MKVSIIIPAYNQAAYLSIAIDSALAQTRHDYEIIVVDDGSTDETAAVAERYVDKIRYIYQANRGLAGARNTGIQMAQGEFIGLLDSDDIWLPEYLESMLDLAQRNAQASVFYCQASCIDEEGRELGQIMGGLKGEISDLRHVILRANFMIPSTMIIRRDVFTSEGLFDEQFRSCEDLDLWLRLTPKHQFAYNPAVLAKYRVHKKSLSASPDNMQKAKRAVTEKHFGLDDGCFDQWTDEKRRAYGGLYKYIALTSIQRKNDWQSGDQLKRAFQIDPGLAGDTDFFYELGLGNQPLGHRGTAKAVNLEANEKQILTLLGESLSSDQPQLRDRAYGTAYKSLALIAYNNEDMPLFRKYIRLAGHYQPGVWKEPLLMGNFLKSFLGKTTLSHLRNLRRSVPH